jgi:hypothetical protein
MNTNPAIVHCIYSGSGKDITEIIIESFIVFLKKELLLLGDQCRGIHDVLTNP